ncbi:MAG: RHS repeat-associated core domain-containing protein [Eubacteriaceae bacterium]
MNYNIEYDIIVIDIFTINNDSITNIVDTNDDVVKSYTYDAYGNTTSTGTFVNSLAYTKAVMDTETGLYYMNARYYDPGTGRFISQDTYRGTGEAFWHLYLYCNSDPVNNIDPTGNIAGAIALGGWYTTAVVSGSALSWTPIGWIILTAVVIVGTIALVNYYNASKTKTYTLDDVDVTQPPGGKPYMLAYLRKNMVHTIKQPMNFKEACIALGATGATNSLKKRSYEVGTSSAYLDLFSHSSYWGIYATTQKAAKALAMVFGCNTLPEVHGSGQYGHYHDGKHKFHIWYGNKIKY